MREIIVGKIAHELSSEGTVDVKRVFVNDMETRKMTKIHIEFGFGGYDLHKALYNHAGYGEIHLRFHKHGLAKIMQAYAEGPVKAYRSFTNVAAPHQITQIDSRMTNVVVMDKGIGQLSMSTIDFGSSIVFHKQQKESVHATDMWDLFVLYESETFDLLGTINIALDLQKILRIADAKGFSKTEERKKASLQHLKQNPWIPDLQAAVMNMLSLLHGFCPKLVSVKLMQQINVGQVSADSVEILKRGTLYDRDVFQKLEGESFNLNENVYGIDILNNPTIKGEILKQFEANDALHRFFSELWPPNPIRKEYGGAQDDSESVDDRYVRKVKAMFDNDATFQKILDSYNIYDGGFARFFELYGAIKWKEVEAWCKA